MTWCADTIVCAQLWSMLVGLPLCALGGVLYSWTSGKGVIDGMISAYGALFKVPGPSSLLSSLSPGLFHRENLIQQCSRQPANQQGPYMQALQASRLL